MNHENNYVVVSNCHAWRVHCEIVMAVVENAYVGVKTDCWNSRVGIDCWNSMVGIDCWNSRVGIDCWNSRVGIDRLLEQQGGDTLLLVCG